MVTSRQDEYKKDCQIRYHQFLDMVPSILQVFSLGKRIPKTDHKGIHTHTDVESSVSRYVGILKTQRHVIFVLTIAVENQHEDDCKALDDARHIPVESHILFHTQREKETNKYPISKKVTSTSTNQSL